MAIPIIFFHNGDSSYLKYSLAQAKYFNPESMVYLLGDASNNKYPFVTHADIDDYSQNVSDFKSVYTHLSTNTFDFELMCFKRWFCIMNLCGANKIEEFVYLDSDVLIFDNLTNIAKRINDCQIANAGTYGDCPSFIYFRSYSAIKGFCDYLINTYTQAAGLSMIDSWYKSYVKENEWGGVCDMTLLHFYYLENKDSFKTINLIDDEIAIDININNGDGYETINGIKKVYWRNNLPYCKRIADGKYIRFVALHYQGSIKELIFKHYKGDKYRLTNFNDQLYHRLRMIKRYFSGNA